MIFLLFTFGIIFLAFGYIFFRLYKKLKRIKERTDAIISNLTDGLLMYDEKNVITLLNSQAEKILKINAKDVLNKQIKPEFFKTEPKFLTLTQALFPFLAAFAKKVGPETETYPKIHEIILQAPNDMILQTATLPVYNNNKEVIGFMKIIRDITREKLVEKTKSEFIMVAAHQLRTPLSAIKWIFRMLMEGDVGKLTPEQISFLKKGDDATQRSINLVSDLLDVAKMEEGRFGYSFEQANIIDIISSALEIAKPEAKERSVKLIFNHSNIELPIIKVDTEHLKQAVQNLLDNAIRYNLPGGEVVVSVEKEDKFLKISIKDKGIGIAPGQLDRIFTKFFRAENALRLQTEGSGLGLYIVKNIIKRHGGDIWFKSEEGKGSIFIFTIPIKEELIPKEQDFEESIKGF